MAEINVTPFVDVMLVLLVIFMVAAPLMMVGVPLDLPKTTAAEIIRSDEPIVVSLNHDGEMFIGDAPVAADSLIEQLSQLRSERPDSIVYVRGDKGTDYGRILDLLGQVGRAGFARISLVAEAALDGGKR
ncbi:MAG TPA: ExbD/TolR family protein [Alphaproteobacteria bacterium]|nr:ExbD/TolR family protein [Alphaproteobacteria bacterium]